MRLNLAVGLMLIATVIAQEPESVDWNATPPIPTQPRTSQPSSEPNTRTEASTAASVAPSVVSIPENINYVTEPPYNYAEALAKSMLFYEAQRSGGLPTNQRVRWRGNSAMNDGSDNNIDLSGGYYDGAGYVKYNFPMAFSSTLISWSVIRYGRTYRALGQYNHALDTIKWATDYFIKCHPEPNVFYGQVSDKSADSQFFGRPEDMTYQRRSYKIDFNNPGTDLAAEAAAAMASAAIVFKTVNPSYSNTLQQHAVELYNFATTAPRGPYSRSIQNAAQAYGTDANYKDELAWAALWLYKLTRLPSYLNDAKRIVNQRTNSLLELVTEFSWNVKTAGVQLLLTEMTNIRKFKTSFKWFCTYSQPEQSPSLRTRSQYTNRGLLYVNQWGPLRYAANTAFICAMAADNNVDTERNRVLAQNQLNYILGSSGKSFVVGFGINPPTKVYHQSSYCPPPPAACNRFDAQTPNAHILYGALVGGPSESDSFMNQRMNQKQSSVTLDYNAGYQATLAAVLDLYIFGEGNRPDQDGAVTVVSTSKLNKYTCIYSRVGKDGTPLEHNILISFLTLIHAQVMYISNTLYTRHIYLYFPITVLFITATTATTATTAATVSAVSSQLNSFNLSEVLNKSLLFYEAQRSGVLPYDNRISWRGDSLIGDGMPNFNMTGGYYDGVSNVKFHFPMAFSMTMLAWGIIEFKDAYEAAGQYDYALDALKWGTDYIEKMIINRTIVGQVGDPSTDSPLWERPEELSPDRRVYTLSGNIRGTDLAAEISAALAAASLAFKPKDAVLSSRLFMKARHVYQNIARKTPYVKYSSSITSAASYPSSGYDDELEWAAIWFYKVTKRPIYKNRAKAHYMAHSREFSWDVKSAAVQLLVDESEQQSLYPRVATYCNWLLNDAEKTPDGLLILHDRYPAKYAANAAFLLMLAYRKFPHAQNAKGWRDIGIKQISYLLGGNKKRQSFVVGFGRISPTQPLHKGSSCPLPPDPCGRALRDINEPNPNILYGALVGGPTPLDDFSDLRTDEEQSRVSLDANAGFQAAVAGIIHLKLNLLLSSSCITTVSVQLILLSSFFTYFTTHLLRFD
ncbi:uncharacterized protein LOC100176349 [Ciona intestinalis]